MDLQLCVLCGTAIFASILVICCVVKDREIERLLKKIRFLQKNIEHVRDSEMQLEKKHEEIRCLRNQLERREERNRKLEGQLTMIKELLLKLDLVIKDPNIAGNPDFADMVLSGDRKTVFNAEKKKGVTQ